MPGLSWEIVRPNAVHLVGLDLDGNEISIEADELEGRVFQHELDHLDGILLVERLDEDQRKEALEILRGRALDLAPVGPRRALARSSLAEDPPPAPATAVRCPTVSGMARLAYLGTPDMAVPPLRALVDAGHDIALVRHPAGPPARPGRRGPPRAR